jgi:hypothetical protein
MVTDELLNRAIIQGGIYKFQITVAAADNRDYLFVIFKRGKYFSPIAQGTTSSLSP